MAPKLLGNEERGRKERGRKEIILAPAFPSYPKIFNYYLILQIQGTLSHPNSPTDWTQVITRIFRIQLLFTSLSVTFKAAEKNPANKLLQDCTGDMLLFRHLRVSLWFIWEELSLLHDETKATDAPKALNLLPAEKWWLQSHGSNKWVKNKEGKKKREKTKGKQKRNFGIWKTLAWNLLMQRCKCLPFKVLKCDGKL